jgi:hypothetical protein
MRDNVQDTGIEMRDLVSQARASDRGVEPRSVAFTPALDTRPDEHPPLEDLAHLPLPGDPYRAHAMPVDQPQHMLCLLFRGVGFKLLSYGNLDSVDFEPSAKPGEGPALVLLFAGLRPCEVRLTGRNLRPLGASLRQHRIAWVREHTGGMPALDDDGMIVASIRLSPVKG